MGGACSRFLLRRILRVLLSLIALSMPPALLLAAPLAVGDSGPSAANLGKPMTVSRLVIRFRPGVHPAQGQVLDDLLLAELQKTLGRTLGVGPPTRTGDQILVLAEPASIAEAKRLVGALRMRPK